MRKSILIGLSIITVAGILLAAFALGFGDTRTKVNAFKSAETEKNTTGSSTFIEPKNESKTNSQFRSIELSEKGAIQYAQSNVSFRIIEPLYIPAGYNFEIVGGKKFTGVATDLEMASFSYINGDEQLTIKETIVVKTKQKTEPSTLPKDTREIVDINGIEGRYSEENGIKLLAWKIGNLSLSMMSWKNEGQNQTSSSLGKEEMINIAKYVREKTPEEAISEAQAKVSFKILQSSYVPEGYALNIPQVSGTRFRGVSVELEQAMLPYTNGKETLDLKELLTINDTTMAPESTTIREDTREIVDINGIKGRFSVEPDGSKYLNWKIGDLSLTISSLTYNPNNVTGSSLSKEEMIKMAWSVK